MKKAIMKFRGTFLLLMLGLLTGVQAIAKGKDVYDPYTGTSEPKNANILYNGAVPYIVFGVVILFLGYVGYRYWHDNRSANS